MTDGRSGWFTTLLRLSFATARTRARRKTPFDLTSLAVLVLCASACAAQAAGRVALVMVADDYSKFQKSLVGTKRATDIAEALTARGFDVMVSTNPSNAAARASLRDFSAKVAGADTALVVLAGHGTATGGQSFFLPANTELGRATDLLSRGLSIANVAQIVSRARVGAVFFFTTIPTFDAPVDGLDARPEVTGEISKNVVVVFSNSPKVPLSRVDAGSAAAAESLARVLRQPDATLADAARAAANGETGMVVGTPGDLAFAAPPPPPPALPAVSSTPAGAGVAPPAASDEADAARLATERAARDLAEKRAREEQARVEQAQQEVARAQAEARKAQADVQKAQAEAQRARAEAERAQAEAEKAKLEAKQIESQAQLAKAQAESAQAEAAKVAASARAETAQAEAAKAEAARAAASAQAQAAQAEAARAEASRLAAAAQASPAPAQPAAAAAPIVQPPPAPPAQVASLQGQASAPRSPGEPLDESRLGQRQRQRIQEGLRELGLYTGPLDGVMGRLTREAVMGYQRSRRASVTGYLTTDQYEDLVPNPD